MSSLCNANIYHGTLDNLRTFKPGAFQPRAPDFLKSRLTIVSREAKKKQAVRDEQVSYLHVAPLCNL